MPKLRSLLLLVTGSGLLAYAFVMGLPISRSAGGSLLDPGPFVESPWLGATPQMANTPSYAPSTQIAAAAILRTDGIWPLNRTWYELLPPDMPPKAVVVLLHGGGRDGLSMLEMWHETGRAHGLLLVAPNGGALRHRSLGRRAVVSSAVAAAKAYGLDAQGMLLFGHSDGAVIAQTLLAETPPGLWRAGAVHAGYALPSAIEAGGSLAPLRMYLGDQDHIFAVGSARQSAESMAAAGHPTTLIVIPGHTHWFYEIGPQIAEDTWSWFAALQD